jgi:hypothetical protein
MPATMTTEIETNGVRAEIADEKSNLELRSIR